MLCPPVYILVDSLEPTAQEGGWEGTVPHPHMSTGGRRRHPLVSPGGHSIEGTFQIPILCSWPWFLCPPGEVGLVWPLSLFWASQTSNRAWALLDLPLSLTITVLAEDPQVHWGKEWEARAASSKPVSPCL